MGEPGAAGRELRQIVPEDVLFHCIVVPAFFLSVGINKIPPDCEELFW